MGNNYLNNLYMENILEINYISPISGRQFNNIENSYHLVFSHLSENDQIIIHDIKLPYLKRVTNSVIAFYVNKHIKFPYEFHPICHIGIFELHKKTNKLKLLFHSHLDLINVKSRTNIQLSLIQPSTHTLSVDYKNKLSYLSELLFNHESHNTSRCILHCVFTSHHLTKTKPIQDDVYPVNSSFVYNRYSNSLTQKTFHSEVCQKIDFNKLTYQDYLNFLKSNHIDVNRYLPTDTKNYSNLLTRKIKYNLRKLYHDDFANNIITASNDGDYLAFLYNASTKLKIGNSELRLNHLIKNLTPFYGGSGYISKMKHHHYKRIYMPYQGNLEGVGFYKDDKSGDGVKNLTVILHFTNTYFTPPDVSERDFSSAISGHNNDMARYFPDIVKTQPEIKIHFYLILVGNNRLDSIQLDNVKLYNVLGKVNINTYHRMSPVWISKGEDLGAFLSCHSHTILLINRKIKFSHDLEYFSRTNPAHSPVYGIETFVKTKDIIGYLQ